MKRIIFFLSMAALMMLAVSCKKDKPATPKVPDGAVDLGIVMTRDDGTTYKLYWAKANLSRNGLCSNPEDYGDFFAWGETAPKDNYSQSNYTYSDNPAVIPIEKDAARVLAGGKWRMPTMAECQALLSLSGKEDYSFDRNYKYGSGEGVYGVLITQKSTGNSLFFPLVGYAEGSQIGEGVSEDGSYWSSTRNETKPDNAIQLTFGTSFGIWAFGNRYGGASIRPVWEE